MSSVFCLAQPLTASLHHPCWFPGAHLAPKHGMHPTLLTPFSFQMSMLVTSLRHDDSEPLQNNYRLAQDLYGRRVLASFQTTLPSTKHLPSGKALVSAFGLHPAVGMQGGDKEQESRLHVSSGNTAIAWVSPAQQHWSWGPALHHFCTCLALHGEY